MYQFTDIAYTKRNSHFWFNKQLVTNMIWTGLPPSAKSIFPVIASYAFEGKEAFPEQVTIAALAGRSEKTVRDGIGHLERMPGFTVKPYVTSRGHKSFKYTVPRPARNEAGNAFPFHTRIITGGNWRECGHPTAHAVYIVMRTFAGCDYDRYMELAEDCELTAGEFHEQFADRAFDICDADKSVLAEHAGISKRSMDAALADLEQHNLLEQTSRNEWRLPLVPPFYYKRALLNKKLAKEFKYIYEREETETWKKLPLGTGNEGVKNRDHV